MEAETRVRTAAKAKRRSKRLVGVLLPKAWANTCRCSPFFYNQNKQAEPVLFCKSKDMSQIRVCEDILRLGSVIRSTADVVIEALEYVNAMAMVCVPGISCIDAGVLDSATETAKEIETISMRASAIVAEVFAETTRVIRGDAPIGAAACSAAHVCEMTALVDRADVLQAELKVVVNCIEAQLFLVVPCDINACVM